jgi:hypothetical protein
MPDTPEQPTASSTALTIRKARCPFYGFSSPMLANDSSGIEKPGYPGLMIDTGGNQCAIYRRSHSPCQMEMQGKPVSWDDCELLETPQKSGLIDGIRNWQVFPDSNRLGQSTGPKGIHFFVWFFHVMGRLG